MNYKFYVNGGKAYFYEKGIEIDNVMYGVKSDDDIECIKERVAHQKRVKVDEITYTDVTFDIPTDEQIARIQSFTTNSMSEMKAYVNSVLSDDMSQDEINAMLMLEIAQLKAGVDSE